MLACFVVTCLTADTWANVHPEHVEHSYYACARSGHHLLGQNLPTSQHRPTFDLVNSWSPFTNMWVVLLLLEVPLLRVAATFALWVLQGASCLLRLGFFRAALNKPEGFRRLVAISSMYFIPFSSGMPTETFSQETLRPIVVVAFVILTSVLAAATVLIKFTQGIYLPFCTSRPT